MKMHNYNFEFYGALFFIGRDYNTTHLKELSAKLFLRQMSAELIGLHVFFTANIKSPNLDQTQVNELLTLTRLSKDIFSEKGRSSNVFWKILDIDAENSVLSIYLEKKQILEQGFFDTIINRLVDKKRTKKTKHPLPTLEILRSKLLETQSSQYLSDVENSLSELLCHICQSSKFMRKSINHVVEVLSFSEDPQKVLSILQIYLEENITNLTNSVSESKLYSRRIDVALYLIFELSDKEISKHLRSIFNQAFDEMLTRRIPLLMLCRGFRHSFLKAMGLARHSSLLIKVVQLTDTDDSISFQIIYAILQTSNSNIKHYHKNFIDLLFQIPKTALIAVARDLRRIVSSDIQVSESYSRHIIDKIDTELSNLEYIPDSDVWMARCLILFYSNSCNKFFLKWIATNFSRIKLNVTQRDTLLALAGYDTPLVISLNKGLFLDGFRLKLISPSRCRHVIEYMSMTMSEWKKNYSLELLNEKVLQDNSLLKLPLITVIITTFDPVLDLFKLSLESIIYQNYPNLEIIIIDDCTPEVKSYSIRSIVRKLKKKSRRLISYQRNLKNIGQYQSRNNALSQAKGEFIAIQDDDDISHPERLYRQIQPLLLDTKVMATHAYHLRISENSRIMIDGNNIGQIVGDAPVSFVWKKRVFEEMGGFLPTRSRGDIEFRNRLNRYYSKQAIKIIHQPLVIMRGGLGTVSSEKEYFFYSAINALRYMMNHTPKSIEDTFDMLHWIPRNLQ